jgi:hypothetical protein
MKIALAASDGCVKQTFAAQGKDMIGDRRIASIYTAAFLGLQQYLPGQLQISDHHRRNLLSQPKGIRMSGMVLDVPVSKIFRQPNK